MDYDGFKCWNCRKEFPFMDVDELLKELNLEDEMIYVADGMKKTK